jgi:hypothetical protein
VLRLRLVVALLAVCCGVALWAAAVASAETRLDQQQPNTEEESGGVYLNTEGEHSVLAQTFTAGLTGRLSSVELAMATLEFGEGTEVQIMGVGPEGRPDGTVLASAPASVPYGEPPPWKWVPVSFAAPASVTAGTQYAIVVSGAGEEEGGIWNFHQGNPYPGGQAWVSYEDPPTSWSTGGFAGDDFTFKTYVTLPPSCSTASGSGSYLSPGEPGYLVLHEHLSTNLSAPQSLRLKTQGNHFKLLRLEEATCSGFPGERVFRGKGIATKDRGGEYPLTFLIAEEGGGFRFTASLTKNGKVIETTGGPLTTTNEKIS